MRMLIAGLFYFALVFVAAFALGIVRTFVLEPRFGEFIAVLCEAPFLLAVMIFAAPRAQRWAKLDSATGPLLGMGLFGLLLQQIAEFGLVLAAGETSPATLPTSPRQRVSSMWRC